MGISQTASAVMAFLAGLLPASCHKETAHPQAPAPVVAIAGSTNTVNAKSFDRKIGEIALTNLNETYVQFSTGENFTLTPKMLDKRNVRITLSVESKDAYGDPHDFAVTQVVTEPGKPLEVAVGGYNLSFTPKVFPGNQN
jgi:hypothetical protein